jgi:hypothetical protein
MSRLQPPQPARPVVSLLMKDRSLLADVSDGLVERLGPIEMASAWLDFDFTDYYTPEMGAPLFRRMLSFRKLIHQSDLADIKRIAHKIETDFTGEGKRRVNIDPGYLLPERFVLATGKNFTHRIYIGRCIYADPDPDFSERRFRRSAMDLSGLCFRTGQGVSPGCPSEIHA